MITIEGLTTKQRIFADVLWGLNGEEEVERFLKLLTPSDRREARVVIDMMLAAMFDEAVTADDLSEAEGLINKIKSK